jgi:electron-transferring-flavoprotein dehydrogenase
VIDRELWEVDPAKHRPGFIQHTIGWPVTTDVYGGSFLYHLLDNGKPLVAIGFVVALDYKNPFLNPYLTFQNFKRHPLIASVLEGGTCIQYGARAISEGGYQSIPKLVFPGGILVGDTAGMLNVPKIKGTHTAMKSGMLAAESAFEELVKSGSSTGALLLRSYEERFKASWVHEELYKCRNIRPSFHWGLWPAIGYSAVDTYLFRGSAPWTFKHGKADHQATQKASVSKPMTYPKPDGKLTFDLLTNLARSGTTHEPDQPIHLTLKDDRVPTAVNLPQFAGPESRYCPAGVYEYVDSTTDASGKELVRNAQNCLHCKTCDIKDPTQNIVWKNPEGGGGPAYDGM